MTFIIVYRNSIGELSVVRKNAWELTVMLLSEGKDIAEAIQALKDCDITSIEVLRVTL